MLYCSQRRTYTMFYIRRFFYRTFSWIKRHRNIKPKDVMKYAKRAIAENCEYDCGIYFTTELDKIQNDYLLLRSDNAGFCNCGQYLYGADNKLGSAIIGFGFSEKEREELTDYYDAVQEKDYRINMEKHGKYPMIVGMEDIDEGGVWDAIYKTLPKM